MHIQIEGDIKKGKEIKTRRFIFRQNLSEEGKWYTFYIILNVSPKKLDKIRDRNTFT